MKLELVNTEDLEDSPDEKIFSEIKKLIEEKLKWEMPVWRVRFILGKAYWTELQGPFGEELITFKSEYFHRLHTYDFDMLGSADYDKKVSELRKSLLDSEGYGRDFLALFHYISSHVEAQQLGDSCLGFFDAFLCVRRLIQLAPSKEEIFKQHSLIWIFEEAEYYEKFRLAELADIEEISGELEFLESWHPLRRKILFRMIDACKTPADVKEIYDIYSFNDPYDIADGSEIAEVCREKYRTLSRTKKKPFKAPDYDEAYRVMKTTINTERFYEANKEMGRLGTYEMLMNELPTLGSVQPHQLILAYRCVELSKTTHQAIQVANKFMDSEEIYWKALDQAATLAKTKDEVDKVLKKMGEWFEVDTYNPAKIRATEKRIHMTENISELIKFCKQREMGHIDPEHSSVVKRLYKLLKQSN